MIMLVLKFVRIGRGEYKGWLSTMSLTQCRQYFYRWDWLTAIILLCIMSLDCSHCHYFHSVDVDEDGDDLHHFSSYLSRTIVLSNFTHFDVGLECFDQRQPWGISTFVADRFPLSIWWLDDLSHTTSKFFALWISFIDVSEGSIHKKFSSKLFLIPDPWCNNSLCFCGPQWPHTNSLFWLSFSHQNVFCNTNPLHWVVWEVCGF